jgi:2-keto-4-pentenoate hydratase/2-oxohepta-3-ene-1,7-dioic acid hydratase in catechol pathway
MRLVRFQTPKDEPRPGWVYEDQIGVIEGSIFGEYRRSTAEIPIEAVRLLPPVQPSKVICVGRNYLAHAKEHNAEVPEIPLLFLKPPSSVIGIGDAIILPPQSNQVEHEAELVVVFGKRGRWITPEAVPEYVLGYTIANDVTARDLQFRDGQWTRGKGFDTFCPLGPWIDTEFDPTDALVTCQVNGEMRQMASTRDMIFNVVQLVAFVSSVMTLEPGDVLLTGTPAGVGPLKSGDVVDISIDGLGKLSNPVRAEATRKG